MTSEHLVALLAVIAVLPVQACDLEEACLGGRPRTPNGCCPVGGGGGCGTGVGLQCDTELGYRCVDSQGNTTTQRGTCTGLYNLHVTDTQTDSVSLEWADFKPDDYYFEYVLLFRKHNYTQDTQAWTQWDIGTRPEYTVRKLSAGTLFCMRVAVWTDARATVLGNFSEVIWVHTEAAPYCALNGREYTVGQEVANCEERCTCTATGDMHCTPVCSSQLEVPEGCHLVYAEECSCNATVVCRDQDSCTFEGEEYEDGSSVQLGCRSCYCNMGTMFCNYPEECGVFQTSEECPYATAIPDPNGGCCPNWTCSQGHTTTTTPPSTQGCVYKGHSYTDGSVWIDTTNCTTCTCQAGDVSCHLACQEPEVPQGCVNPRQQMQESGCCPEIVCDPSEGEDQCSHNGTVYHRGATFTSECSLCLCGQGGRVNCSFAPCPPLEMVRANVLCPNPHVRRDGCCDTVFCFEESPDPQILLSRLMALSFEPTSLTISFDVDHVTSQNTVTRDRYEVMTSDRDANGTSWTSRTYTPSTLDEDDNISSTSDLLHADAAIRVDDRVFITLDGLNPNTSYYVRVEPVVKRDMGVTGSSPRNTTLVGFFVARTKERVATCQVGEKAYEDGAVVSETCEETCRCLGGEVHCQSSCPEEQLVMEPSASCPRPMLVPAQNSCCKAWRCLPEDGGCLYKEMMLKDGEHTYDGWCGQKCTCRQGTVTCRPVCLPVSPLPRPQCVLTNITNNCCPVWMCPQETKPPVGLSLASQVGFEGTCSRQEETFKSSLKAAFERWMEGRLLCANRESPHFVRCWMTDVVIKCPLVDVYRRRREPAQIFVVAVVAANITESSTVTKIQTSLNTTAKTLASMLSAGRITLRVDSEMDVTSSGSFHSLGVTFICDPDFVYKHSVCVPEYPFPPSRILQRQNLSLTLLTASYKSATFVWPRLTQNALSFVNALVLELREASSALWNRTVRLDPRCTNQTVGYLSPVKSYLVRLVALTNSSSAPRVVLSSVRFTTTHQDVLTSALTLDPLHVSLGTTSATIGWKKLSRDVIAAISSFKITYRKSQDVDDVMSRDLDPRDSHVTLDGLESRTAYVSRFRVSLVNGTALTMPPLHFVTTGAGSSGGFVVPVMAVCAVIAILSVMIPVTFFVWRRMRRKSPTGIAFENKTYGKDISSLSTTQAKNDGARPQDMENGGVAGPSTGARDCQLQA